MYGVIGELSAIREAGREDFSGRTSVRIKTKDRMWTILPLCLFLISKFALFSRWLPKMVEGQVLVLDSQGHLLGSPEAIVAKQVLLGWKVVVCCEGISISGNCYRNKLKYLAFHQHFW